MLTFTRAPTVSKGDKITSKQFRLLARAFNDRIRAGFDCDWRIAWLHFNLWRQVRNPSADGFVFPPQSEFFDIYQGIEPETGEGTTWPEAGPGEPEGFNLANPVGQFVFGIADPAGGPGLDSEADRLNALPFLLTPSPTLEDIWELGKAQRGAYEPATGSQNTPAFDAAQSVFRIVQPFWSPHGKAYGGWLPNPGELLSDCGGTPATGEGVPSYAIKFTGLRADVPSSGLHGAITHDSEGRPIVTYAGSCPCGSDSYAPGHVLGLSSGPFAYYVFVGDGGGTFPDCTYDVDRLPVKDWIEGPYTGEGVLNHTDGRHLQRALWQFQTDFRGTPDQRTPDSFKIEDIAFDNQDFFTRQYPLSPAIGTIEGGFIVGVYPKVTFTGANIPQGTFGSFGAEGTQHQYGADFVLGGVFAKATNLFAPCSVEFLDVSEGTAQVIARLNLVPDATGTAYALKYLPDAGQVTLKVRLGSDAKFKGSGTIVCEATEQLEYKPEFWDAYLVSRFGASQGGDPFGAGVDGRGKDTSNAKDISDTFFATGAITWPGVRSSAEWINDNPVFDSARRASKDVRILRRQQLVAYEVTGGKSVLYFKRFPQYPGIDGAAIQADLFDGIAPPLAQMEPGIRDLTEGETYIVRATGIGKVVYLGTARVNNETFTATTEKAFERHGDAQLYVHDGIRHAALKAGLTNEWVGFLQTKCYHPSPTSIWKPEAYSDYFAWCNRCHFYSGTATAAGVRRFFNINNSTSIDPVTFTPILNPISVQANFIAPEAPTGFNYAGGANTHYGSDDFYKSCQVYEAPWEIESCVVDDWAPDQIVKVTMKTRLRAHPDAPATVAKDPLTWITGERDALATESYRTPDNAVREYVLSLVDGGRNCTFKTGDAGTASSVETLDDNPFGSCYPHFFFVHLVPEPFEDNNDTVESHDTRCTVDAFQQMETYTRAMCEGFIDQRTSEQILCAWFIEHGTALGNLYNYTFENLCFDAFGGRWIGAFNLDKRPDEPSGFGPLPNTEMYADVFNRLAKSVNLLDKVRLDMPIAFRYRTYTFDQVQRPVTLTQLDGTTCTMAGTCKAYGDSLSAVTPSTVPAPDAWADWPATIIGAAKICEIGTVCPYELVGTRTDTEYRTEVDPAFLNAVPIPLRELIDNGNTGFMAIREDFQQGDARQSVAEPDSDGCSTTAHGFWQSGTEYFRWMPKTPIVTSRCELVTSGILEAPPVPPADYKFGVASGVPCGNLAAASSSLTLLGEQNAFIKVPLIDAT